MSSIDSFNNNVFLNTSFKRLAFNPKTGKYTAAYRRFLRDNAGRQVAYEIDRDEYGTSPLPLRPGDVYNPSTNRIVSRSSMYRRKTKTGANAGLNIVRAPVQKSMVRGFERKLNEFYKGAPGSKMRFDLTGLNAENRIRFLSSLRTNPRALITLFGEQGKEKTIYTISSNNLGNILALANGYIEESTGANAANSDAETVAYIIDGSPYIELQLLPESTLQQGAFFKYTLNHEIPDVEQYGLYQTVKPEHYQDCCFVNALIASGKVDEATLTNIRMTIKCAYLPMKKIKEIAERFNLHIVIRGLATKSKRLNVYGNKQSEKIEIGLVDQHYFFINKTQVTSYALKHYEELKHKPRWNEFFTKDQRDPKRFITSLEMFKLLVNNEDVKRVFLSQIKMTSEVFSTPHFQKIDEFPALSVSKKDYANVMDYEKIAEKTAAKQFYSSITHRIFFDFETNVYNNKHTPYLGWYADEDGNTKKFLGERCGKFMLNKIYETYGNLTTTENGKTYNHKVLMIAHNSGYDFTTGLFRYMSNVETIEKGSSMMTARGDFYYYGRKTPIEITVHCSYAKIPEPLRKFGKMFQLDQEKEVMPYPVYNTINIKKKVIKLKECLSALKRKEHTAFIDNCNKWGCIDGDMVDIIEYSSRYCEMDCIVLRAGYLKFQTMVSEICESLDIADMNIDHFISAASIADNFIKMAGCYDGCVEMCGVPRAYIQRCLVGGRTMLNSNTQQSAYGVQMADYDAVSLYPSAMNRLEGFLKGAPKLISSTDYATLCKDADGFFVRVKITKVGTHRAFPLLSFKNEQGIRMFSNDMIGKTIYIDDVSLADAVTFQNVEFEIIDGYMFDEGFNTKIVPTIRHLFNARLKAKKDENPVQAVIKLIMNSCYGKTALKEIAEDAKYVKNADFEKFVTRNYQWVKEAVPTEDGRGYRIKTIKAINTHFNRVHIGIQILSMSKRIMNEVMCLADDKGLKIYYQDTDSMHILNHHVPILEKAFGEKYGRQLNGKDMGQFHVDFELDGAKNVYAENSIFLGKKSYIDCLVGEDKDGNEVRGFHIRMKGVPNGCILGECKKRKCSPFDLYEELKDGKKVKFDLLVDEDLDAKVRFKKNNNMTMTTVKKFERVVSFPKASTEQQ